MLVDSQLEFIFGEAAQQHVHNLLSKEKPLSARHDGPNLADAGTAFECPDKPHPKPGMRRAS